MARSDLTSIFTAVKLPVVQGHWAADEKPSWPFIEYHMEGTRDLIADNSNYRKIDAWSISVYSLITDMDSFYTNCESLEAQFASAGIVYERSMDVFTGEGTVYAEYTINLPR